MTWLIDGNNDIDETINFLGTTNTQPLIVRTNHSANPAASERMRVSAFGNVGIGTSDPRHGRLTIEDRDVPLALRESGQTPSAGGLWRVALDGGSLRFDANTAAGGDFSSFATPLAMSLSGNVGIGTTSPPSSRFQLKSLTAIDEGASPSDPWANFGQNAFFDGAWKRIDQTKAGVNFHINPVGAGQEFRFLRVEADGSNLRNLAVIGSTTSYIREGNFGIGTTDPRERCQLGSTLVFHEGGHAVMGFGWAWNNGTLQVLRQGFPAEIRWAPIEGILSLGIDSSSRSPGQAPGIASTLTLIPNGNVGIGATPPTHRFHVRTLDAVGLFESTGTQAYLRLSTNEGLNNRVEITNRPGGRLSLWTAGGGDALNITRGGIVGIGTTTPSPASRLDVAGDVTIRGRLGTNGFPPTPHTTGWGGGLRTWDLEVEATAWVRSGVETGPRDLAENFASDMDLDPGDVVCMGHDEGSVVISEKPEDGLVLGVVSSKPGLLLNSDHDADDDGTMFPIALCGLVPCKVVDENGPIERGDLLTSSSTPGHAMKASSVMMDEQEIYRPGTIIGKAVGPLQSGTGVIEVFVTAR